MESRLASKSQSSDRADSASLNGMAWHYVASTPSTKGSYTVQTQLPQRKAHTLKYYFIILSFINRHTFSLIITYIKTSSANPMGLRSPGCEIEAPSMCYPTLPMLILRQVPVGMHTPIPTPMIKTSKKGMEGRDPQVLRQCTRKYSCVAYHHHEDHNTRT